MNAAPLTAGERRILERRREQVLRWAAIYRRWAERRAGTNLEAYWLERAIDLEARAGCLEVELS